VVSGKKAQDCSQRRHWFQHVAFSYQNAVETRSRFLVISELLLVDCRQAWKVHWFWLFDLALARIQEDGLVRAGAEARSA
jgi:hypothetical protein